MPIIISSIPITKSDAKEHADQNTGDVTPKLTHKRNSISTVSRPSAISAPP